MRAASDANNDPNAPAISQIVQRFQLSPRRNARRATAPTPTGACACPSAPARRPSRPRSSRRTARARRAGAAAVRAAVPGRREHSRDAHRRLPAQRRDQRALRGGGAGETASRRPDLLAAGRRRTQRDGHERCASEILSWTRAPRVSGGPSTDDDVAPLLAFYRDGAARRLRRRHSARAEALARVARSSCSASSKTRRTPRRAPSYRVSRPHARVAPVVLPLEQHPRRRAARGRRARRAARRRKVSSGRCSACSRTRARRRSSRTSPGSGCTCATSTPSCPCRANSPTSTTRCAQGLKRETELFFGSIVHEDRSALDLLRADYTFVNERVARLYGLPNIKGNSLPPRDAAGRQPAPRPARPRQHPHRHVVSGPHVARRARQVDPRELARGPAAAAAGRRARARGDGRRAAPRCRSASGSRRIARTAEPARAATR